MEYSIPLNHIKCTYPYFREVMLYPPDGRYYILQKCQDCASLFVKSKYMFELERGYYICATNVKKHSKYRVWRVSVDEGKTYKIVFSDPIVEPSILPDSFAEWLANPEIVFQQLGERWIDLPERSLEERVQILEERVRELEALKK